MSAVILHGETARAMRLLCLGWLLCICLLPASSAQAQIPDPTTQELLLQQERERALREQQETRPDVRMEPQAPTAAARLPSPDESPCFRIDHIVLNGDAAEPFRWALRAADPESDPATGRCLGVNGINVVMGRVQNAIVAHGYVTTRILAAPQDLNAGTLALTVVPGRIRAIRFAEDVERPPSLRNAVVANVGDLLNLRDIEQSLENLQRVPTVSADIQIVPAQDEHAQPGESDLVIRWTQPHQWRVNLTLDDSGSQATGKIQAGATVSLDNALGWNDLLYVNLGRGVLNGNAQNTASWTAHYSLPLGFWLASATLSSYDYHQTVVGPFQSYTYSGHSENAEARLSRLLHRSISGKTSTYARLWQRTSDSYIDDVRIDVQHRRVAGWEAGLTHKHFMGAAVLDGSIAYRRGTGAFHSLPAPEELFNEGTSRMKLITADAQLAVPFKIGEQSLRYNASWRGQWNQTPLIPQDRFAIGGRYTVRGFDGQVSLTGERGWLWRNDVGMAVGGGQELYVGMDYGRTGGPSTEFQLGNSLAGAVIGLRGGANGLSWDAFFGAPLAKPGGFPTASTTYGVSLGWGL
jgi:hemolysin activation/secretion protein